MVTSSGVTEDCLRRVRQNIASEELCKNETVSILDGLFGSPKTAPAGAGHDGTIRRVQTGRNRAALKEVKQPKQSRSASGPQALPEAERIKFATEVVNLSLKALTNVIRTGNSTAAASVANETVKSTARPQLSAKADGIRNIAHSATMAFRVLCAVESSSSSGRDYRIEAGISAFVGKLIALNLFDLATQEVRHLLLRLRTQFGDQTGSAVLLKVHDIAEVVALDGWPKDKQGLSLVISSQIHCLKLLLHSETKASRATLKSVQQQARSGPFQLIKASFEQGYTNAIETARLNRSLVSSLGAIGSKLASLDADTTSKLCLLDLRAAFEYQALSLQTLMQGNKLINRETDFTNDVLIPLGRYIRASLRQAADLEGKFYEAVAAKVATILETCDAKSLPAPDREAFSVQVLRIKTALVALGKACVGSSEATKQFQETVRGFEKASFAQITNISLLAEMSIAAIEANIEPEALLPHLCNLARQLERSTKGLPQQVDEILISLSSLRRKVIESVRPHLLAAQKIGGAQSYVQLLASVMNFVWQYFQGLWDQSAQDRSRIEQRSAMVNRIARPSIDSLLIFSRSIAALDEAAQTHYLASLGNCVKMVDLLQHRVEKGYLPNLDERLTGIRIKLSDQLLSLHLHCRSHTQDMAIGLQALGNAVRILETGSLEEQVQGHLVEKTLRLIKTLSTCGRDTEANSTLSKLAMHCRQSGALERAVSVASTQDQELVQRVVYAYARMQKPPEKTLCQLFSVSSNDLGLELRGFLAECHMSANSSILLAGGNGPPHMMAPALEALTRIYTSKRFPVRRLRVLTWVLQIAQFWPSASDQSLTPTCQNEIYSFDLDNAGDDEEVMCQVPSLLALAQISLAFLGDKVRMDFIRSALTTWRRVITSDDKNIPAVLARVPLAWTQMLSLAEFLAANYYEEEYAASLAILEYLSQHGICDSKEDKAVVAFKQAETAVQAGHLDESQDLLSKVEGATAVSLEAPFYLRAHAVGLRARNSMHSGDEACAATHLGKAEQILSGTTSDASSKDDQISVAMTTAALLGIASDRFDMFGDAGKALLLARAAAKSANTAWRLIVKKLKLSNVLEEDESKVQTSAKGSKHDVAQNRSLSAGNTGFASTFAIATELINSLARLSKRNADAGLVQDARQHLRQAERLAQVLKLDRRMRKLTILSAIYGTAQGQFSESIDTLAAATDGLASGDNLRFEAEIEIARALLLGGHSEDSKRLIVHVCDRLEPVNSTMDGTSAGDPVEQLQRDIEQLKISKKRTIASRHDGSPLPKATRRKQELVPAVKKPATIDRGPRQQLYLAARTLQIEIDLVDHEKSDAWRITGMEEIAHHSAGSQTTHAILRSHIHLRHALDALVTDPIFNSLTDAPLSCPGRNMHDLEEPRAAFVPKTPAKPKRAVSRAGSRAQGKGLTTKTDLFPAESLAAFREALRCLEEVHSLARMGASTSVLHDMAYSLCRVSMLLAAAGVDHEVHQRTQGLIFALETGRTCAWARQSSALFAEQFLAKQDELALLKEDTSPLAPMDLPAMSLQSSQTDISSILPRNWTAVSISLSIDRRELQVSRLRNGSAPFVLALPLGRNFDACEEAQLSFRLARAELLEIVKMANFSSHDSADMAKKGAKTEWWRTRMALDERLKDLLENMDRTWLGGFAGLFAQREISPKAFKIFSDRFAKMLDKHLPSRSGRAAAKKAGRVELDTQILEIFVGLNLPKEEGDLDEPLLDLLAFVVDTLQFGGERNAFDEVDFDAMAIDTLDLLHMYHCDAEKAPTAPDFKAHMVLVLDKHLHCFPWESLPSMQDLSITRLPSLQMLRVRLLEQRQQATWTEHDDLYLVNYTDGACVLNPGGDLINTENTFQESLARLPETWTKVVRRAPEESELTDVLRSHSLYVYLGHGSGGQYIRGRTVKKLDKCAVSLLLGCSSATVTEAGQYESYGTPLTYLQGGAPAVVGTLWDVTDKDIDRFSMRMLQHWGLFDEEPFGPRMAAPTEGASKAPRGRKKAEATKALAKKAVGLDTAVCEARTECVLRYLNGAAPVIYGIPVFLQR